VFLGERHIEEKWFIVVIGKCGKDKILVMVVNVYFALEFREKKEIWMNWLELEKGKYARGGVL